MAKLFFLSFLFTETKAWEVDTFRGHANNVSCAVFHPRSELVNKFHRRNLLKKFSLYRFYQIAKTKLSEYGI
jgi:hypothetical protein